MFACLASGCVLTRTRRERAEYMGQPTASGHRNATLTHHTHSRHDRAHHRLSRYLGDGCGKERGWRRGLGSCSVSARPTTSFRGCLRSEVVRVWIFNRLEFGKSFSGRKRNRRHVAGATRFLRSCPIIQRVPDVLNRSPISFQTPHRVRFNEKDPFSARKLCPLETKRRDHSTSLSTDTVMPTISTVKTDKPAERERERDRDNYHGKASNRVRPKINRKNTSTATSFTPPLRNRDHRCRIRIPSVAGGYLCVALSIEPPPASFHPTLHAGGERRSKEPR